jgi:hypothetical protein
MAYQAELDDHPLEVRRGLALNTLPFWPKHPGFGNVAIEEDSVPTYSIYKPDGTLIATGLLANASNTGGVTWILLTVDASNEETYQLGEGYRIDIKWLVALGVGMLRSQYPEALETIRFSVVREPYLPRLSLNDFVEEASDAGQFLLGQAQAIEADRTAAQHASVLAIKAWTDVHKKLQGALRSQGRIYPRLFIDRTSLESAVLAQALHRLFRSESGDERARRLAEDWKAEASLRFSAIDLSNYDKDDDGVAETELRTPINKFLRRSW